MQYSAPILPPSGAPLYEVIVSWVCCDEWDEVSHLFTDYDLAVDHIRNTEAQFIKLGVLDDSLVKIEMSEAIVNPSLLAQEWDRMDFSR